MNVAKVLQLMPFIDKLDPETVECFVEFAKRAMNSGDVNEYVKRHLKKILATTRMVEVEYEDVTPKRR